MEKIKDEELENIKKRKLEELMIRARKGIKGSASEASHKPVDLSDFTFNKFINDNYLAVVDCWAPWCGPCRFVTPIIEELARDYKEKIAFGKLNVDQNSLMATQYSIRSIPTLLVFRNGKLVDQIIGAMPRQRLEPRITRHL